MKKHTVVSNVVATPALIDGHLLGCVEGGLFNKNEERVQTLMETKFARLNSGNADLRGAGMDMSQTYMIDNTGVPSPSQVSGGKPPAGPGQVPPEQQPV